MISRFFCLFLTVLSVHCCVAQNDSLKSYEVHIPLQMDTMLLMNGKYKVGYIDELTGLTLNYSYNKKIALSKLYSYTREGERVVHYQDRSVDYLTQDQMRALINGKQIGLEKYNNKAIIISSFALSLASSLFDTYESINDPSKNPDFTSPQFSGDRFFQRSPSFGQLLMPLVFTFSITAFKPELKTKHLKNQNYLRNELVIEGFQTTAKRKKFYGAMFSGIAGTLTGLVAYGILKP